MANHLLPALPAWPSFEEDEIAAAASVLRSGNVNYWTGNEGREFEKEFAAYVECSHAVAVANGTVALELALRALKIGALAGSGAKAKDEVIVPSRSYFATASAVVAVGARPVFADIDRNSQNITAETIQAAITPLTRAVIVVHLAGWPCDMKAILKLTQDRGLKVIEDCAQAHGATFNGRKVGSFGDIGTFSFCQDKIMTTAGEGGMVTTNSPDLWERMWAYKDHGKSHEIVHRRDHAPGFRWQHESFGTNWRLTELQSAIGRLQLCKLPRWLAARRRNATRFLHHCGELRGLRVPHTPPQLEHAFYKAYVFVEPELLTVGWNRDRIAQRITGLGVPCSTGSCSEIYLEAAFPPQWRPVNRLPVAQELGNTSLMFQVHTTLQDEHIDRMCAAVAQVMAEATSR